MRGLCEAYPRLTRSMDLWATVTSHIARTVGQDVATIRARPVAGGCIHQATELETTAGKYFVKYGPIEREEMFAAEAEALRTIRNAGVIRAPSAICWGLAEAMSFLVIEHLDLIEASVEGQMALGRRLAALHRVTQPQFGWHRHNSIGTTPQMNTYASDWIEFFRERRLRFQLALAARNGYSELAERAERLLERLGSLFSGYRCSPSLLHGDLWYGNAAATVAGEPVIFDPA